MITLDARHREILKMLIKSSKPITTKKIAQELKVSSRTIRNDLQNLQGWLDKYNIKIIKKPRIGVSLKGSNEDELLIIDKLSETNNHYIEPYSAVDREKYIISKLLQMDNKITSQQLADELFVSRVTIYKDLENVGKWLAKYNLKLIRKPNYGLEVTGNEENWRKAISAFLVNSLETNKLKNLVQEPFVNPLDKRLDPSNLKQLSKMFPGIDIRKIEEIVLESETKMDARFIEESYTALIVHLAISIQRLKDFKDIKMSKLQLSKITNTKEFEIAKFIGKKLEEDFNIKIPESEIGYISLHILGAKIYRSLRLKEETIEEILKDFDRDLVDIVYDMIRVTENTLDVKLSNDKLLITGLALHLRPVINRIKNGMNLHNPILNHIKEKYTSLYGIAWITAGIIEKRLGIKVSEEEVGYLAMHLGAAIDRATAPKKALVVCSSGIGTAQMLSSRLKKFLPELLIEDVVSISRADEILKHKTVDLIISTIPLNNDKFPVVFISPLVTENDLVKIRDVIGSLKNIKIKNIDSKHENSIVKDLIPEELIFLKKNFKSKEDIIDKIGNKLVDLGYVKPEFIKSAQDREKFTSTYIGKCVAIPHGEDRFVIKPTVSVITIKDPIDWWGKEVYMVFYLALRFDTSKYTKRFFKEFYDILDNPEILDQIKKADNPLEIKYILS